MEAQVIKYLCLLVFVLAAGCGGNGAELGPYPSSSETTGTQEQAATCGSCSFLETFSFSGAPGTFTQTNVTIPSGSGYPPGTLATIGTHLCGLGGITGTFSNTLAPNGAWQSNYLGYWSNNNTRRTTFRICIGCTGQLCSVDIVLLLGSIVSVRANRFRSGSRHDLQ